MKSNNLDIIAEFERNTTEENLFKEVQAEIDKSELPFPAGYNSYLKQSRDWNEINDKYIWDILKWKNQQNANMENWNIQKTKGAVKENPDQKRAWKNLKKDMDARMDTNLINLVVQGITATIMLISVIFVYKTIKLNQSLNQKILFNEIVKQERELRINLFDYKQRIEDKNKPKKEREILAINHDTLLFNYYEYLSICIFKSLIDERESKLYFLSPLNAVKNLFDLSILFEEEYAEKEQYPGVQWLFKKWDID